MELRDYLRILHANWVLILAATFVGLAGGAGASLLATEVYESRAQLYVSVQSDSQATGDLVQGSNFARQNMATFIEIATTQSVLGPVAEELGLDLTPIELASQVSASAPVNSSLLNISVSDTDPVVAADIANAVGARMATLIQTELEPPRTEDGVSPVQVQTVQPASPATAPSSPNVKINLALGLLVGLAVGIGIAVLRSVLDTRIRSLEDVEKVTDAPILGGIIDDPNAKERPLVVHTDPKNPRAESFRTLRTNVQFLAVGDGPKTFVVSSPGPSEGKSTVSTNLSIALAEMGFKVALIDCDLRKPRVAEYMGIEGSVGLTDVLIGRADITDVLQRWGRTHLYVLPAGNVAPNPSELLGSQRMDDTLGSLREHVDYIILDAPPVLLVTDASIIGKKGQGVILVSAAGSTRRDALDAAVRALETAHVALRGIALTMLPSKGSGRYGFGYYGDDVYAQEQPAPQTRRSRKAARKLD